MQNSYIQALILEVKYSYATHLDTGYVFHNLAHTVYVVEAVKTIAKSETLPSGKMDLLLIAAWMHDIGFLVGHENHELYGSRMAKNMMTSYGFSPVDTKLVEDLIVSTRQHHQPVGILESILADANNYYLSQPDFMHWQGLLRKELENMGYRISYDEWKNGMIDRLINLSYHTSFSKAELEPGKQENLIKLLNNTW